MVLIFSADAMQWRAEDFTIPRGRLNFINNVSLPDGFHFIIHLKLNVSADGHYFCTTNMSSCRWDICSGVSFSISPDEMFLKNLHVFGLPSPSGNDLLARMSYQLNIIIAYGEHVRIPLEQQLMYPGQQVSLVVTQRASFDVERPLEEQLDKIYMVQQGL